MTKKTEARVAESARGRPTPTHKRPRGRPTKFSYKLAERLCEQLGSGVPLTLVCREPAMPDRTTVHRWEDRYPHFCIMIRAARERAADALADACLLIAENLAGDVGRDRMRITTRMWLASKLSPRRFGDRISAEVSLLTTEQMLASHLARFGGQQQK